MDCNPALGAAVVQQKYGDVKTMVNGCYRKKQKHETWREGCQKTALKKYPSFFLPGMQGCFSQSQSHPWLCFQALGPPKSEPEGKENGPQGAHIRGL